MLEPQLEGTEILSRGPEMLLRNAKGLLETLVDEPLKLSASTKASFARPLQIIEAFRGYPHPSVSRPVTICKRR